MNVRRVVTLSIVFLAGALVGALAVGLTARQQMDAMMLRWAVSNTFEETLTLRQLAGDRGEAAEARLFAALPHFAARLAADPSGEQVPEALWAIRLAYSAADRPLPPEVAPLLDDLPADAAPRCRRIQERMLGRPDSSPPTPAG